MNNFDAIVVGAGIAGTAVARELARSAMRVAVVEASSPGSGITAAGMGHVVAMDGSPAQLALTVFSRSLWRQDAAQFPSSLEYESPGTLWIAEDQEELDEVQAKQAPYAAAGVSTRMLSPSQLAQAEPNLRTGLAGALLVEDDGITDPPAVAAYYLQQAQTAGAVLFSSRAITAAEGTVQLADGQRLSAPRIVLATGCDSALLPAMPNGKRQPIQKRKGHLTITESSPGFVTHQLVELGYLKSAHVLQSDSVAFNAQPRRNGQIVIGSSRQYGTEDPAIEPAMMEKMLARAAEFLPKLPSLARLRTWTGFRAATEDKLPLLGPVTGLSDDPTLWLAAGFEGLGITSAPGTARLLADQILHRESPIDRQPYLPSRLAKTQEKP